MSDTMVDQLPDLLGSRLAAKLCGVSQGTFNSWVRQGLVPDECVHPTSYSGWTRYSKKQLRRWLARELPSKAAS